MIPLWLATLFMIVYLICYVIYHWHEDATTKSAKKKKESNGSKDSGQI